MNRVIVGLIGAGFLLAISGARADETPSSGEFSAAVVEQINLANKLIALGDARNDPLLLIAAARLQKTLGADAAGLPQASNKVPDVLARARKLSEGRKDLTGLIDDLASMRSKSFREDCNGLHHGTVCLDAVLY